ncbi:MAG TPA: YceI family protein [Candidatus Limnocylindria bacterium]|nr:YceI family protein [Candidatus Limnocylindria bacterium]
MKHSHWTMSVAALALVAIVPAAWAADTYRLDPAHTQVGFSIRHIFSKVPGRFNEFSGAIHLDEKNLATSSVQATINAASISTNHDKRDGHLRSADFFDVEKHPSLTFKSTKVTPGPDKAFKVDGDLTIRGVTKPVTLDVVNLGSGTVMVEGNAIGGRAGYDVSTTINRKDFGIVWNKSLDQGGTLLGDEVTIQIQVEAVKETPETAKPAAAGTPSKGAATPATKDKK